MTARAQAAGRGSRRRLLAGALTGISLLVGTASLRSAQAARPGVADANATGAASAPANPAAPPATAKKPAATGPAAKPGAHAHAQPPKQRASATPKYPPHYLEIMHGWHAVPTGSTTPHDEHGRALLVLSAINGGEKVALAATRDDGGFRAEELDRAARILREPGSGNQHPVDPRLLDVVYQLEVHFGAPEIRVLSGYRTPRRNGASNHGRGRAMDIVVPGVKDVDLAKFAREIGFVGVGIYPTSGFVHVDIRSRSYFWSDASGPGRKNRERGILGDLARASDAAALARGERATAAYGVSFDVNGALRAGQSEAEALDTDDDDDPDEGDGDGMPAGDASGAGSGGSGGG